MPDLKNCLIKACSDKTLRRWIAVLALIFIAAIVPFSIAWYHEQGSLMGMHLEFWNSLWHDPLYQVTAIDFTTIAFLILIWMIHDSKKRGHPRRIWYWFPLFMISPSVGTLGYLLTRRIEPENHE